MHPGAGDEVFIVEETFVGSTNATVIDLAEDLARPRRLDRDICDFAFGGVAFAFLYGGFLMSWERHGWWSGEMGMQVAYSSIQGDGIPSYRVEVRFCSEEEVRSNRVLRV